jgi:hypothetical protein
MAGGGILMPRPGGTLATLGEAGQPEAVIPLGRGGGAGLGPSIVINVAGSVITENEVMDTVNDKLMRRLFSQRNLAY